jgi:hypothetical protein
MGHSDDLIQPDRLPETGRGRELTKSPRPQTPPHAAELITDPLPPTSRPGVSLGLVLRLGDAPQSLHQRTDGLVIIRMD